MFTAEITESAEKHLGALELDADEYVAVPMAR